MARERAAFEFKPFSPKQKKILTWWTTTSPYKDFDFIVAEGAIRSGKTVAMIDSFFTWSLHAYSGTNFIIAGRSMGALVRNVLDPAMQILRAKGITFKYHRAEHYLEIGSNYYYLFGANTEASQDTLQGLTAAGAFADEVALMPQSFVNQMVGRCSVEGAKIFFNCNPEGPYHWFKKDYIDKALEKRVLHLHFLLTDNFSLPRATIERYERMFSGVFYMRYIEGKWVMAEGIVYDMFDHQRHVIYPNQLPKDFERYYIGIDYGTSNPCAFILIGEYAGKYYAVKEYYYDSRADENKGKQKTDAQYKQDLIKFMGDLPIYALIIDPSAASFMAELRDSNTGKIESTILEADNDVLPGILNFSVVIKNDRFYTSSDCVNLLREFGSYVWDEKAQEHGEDKVVKKHDHALDAVRYVMRYLIHHQKPKVILRKTTYDELLGLSDELEAMAVSF